MAVESNLQRHSARPVVVAGVAVIAAVALLGGPATFAFWNDQTTQDPQAIDSSAGISLTASVESAPYALGSVPSTAATSEAGLIPGTRGEKLTYTMTSGATDGVQGYISGTLTAAGKSAWAAVHTAGYLTSEATSNGACTVDPVPAVIGDALTWSFATSASQTVKPGQTCTIVLDLSIPAISNGVDVSRAVRASRGADQVLNPLADFTVDAVLTQVPRAEEK